MQTLAGLPLAASLVAALMLSQRLRAVRRRDSLNQALHELRRPVQAMALAAEGMPWAAGQGVDGTIRLAAAALERLEKEINGAPEAAAEEAVSVGPLLGAAVGRWRARAALDGGSLELRWAAGGAAVSASRAALGQAIDNLIVNAIEHGGPAIVVEGRLRDDRLRICVADSGAAASRGARRRRGPGGDGLARLLDGRRHRGHGLTIVRRIAAAHGGRFVLRRSERGSLAVLELPATRVARRPAA